ncbi:dihydrofolate reductase family protein [Bradyrhizobium jicamae]|uniref:Dihydrofolate reductase family protein n=1 Tax=Bradyrhizobium jicamae TaxID=280332 RepID=A0ABS5FAX6_9BRAD|nr:dihydrofolate reductase family protein [Bradyrhizobium jicamae]MBR0793887.1 dihydrofolate reductase family protein [Bradyrhizobium jicamae]MBR0933341.1 dihydrofolate reductase family protein [Bradyrhizobium jicamae]
MGKVRTSVFTVSIDGFGAAPRQSLEHPFGEGGLALPASWFFETRTFREMTGQEGGSTGLDDEIARKSMENIGAWILGRNMFGPVRGPWPDESWKGWWGDNPPYHTPVFVLTHHARPDLPMEGGTTFHFVTDGIVAALERARAAAQGRDIRVGGGVAVVRQFLAARLLDELHLVLPPVVLGEGESLFAGLDLPRLGYAVADRVVSPNATHVTLARKSS